MRRLSRRTQTVVVAAVACLLSLIQPEPWSLIITDMAHERARAGERGKVLEKVRGEKGFVPLLPRRVWSSSSGSPSFHFIPLGERSTSPFGHLKA